LIELLLIDGVEEFLAVLYHVPVEFFSDDGFRIVFAGFAKIVQPALQGSDLAFQLADSLLAQVLRDFLLSYPDDCCVCLS